MAKYTYLPTFLPKRWFKDKKKHKDGITVTVKLACDKDIAAAAEYSEMLSETKKSAYQETSAFTSDFNHPSKDYVNYQLKWWALRMMIKTVVDRAVD